MVPVVRLSLALILAIGSFFGGNVSAATVTSASYSALTAAIAFSTNVQLAFDGVIQFPAPITISNRMQIDATGRDVAFDGRNANQLFIVTTNGDLTIRGVTLRNGATPNSEPGSPGVGGAIVVTNASLTLVNCAVKNNSTHGGPYIFTQTQITNGGSAFGGAVAATASRVAFTNCTFESNGAFGANGSSVPTTGPIRVANPGSGYGGCIYADGNSDIKIGHCVFRSNSVRGGSGLWEYGQRDGGALGSVTYTFDTTVVALSASIFMENGTARAVNCCQLIAQDCTFKSNLGGALALVSTVSTGSVTRCLFLNNSVSPEGVQRAGPMDYGFGGGAIWHQRELRLSQSTFISNRAVGYPFQFVGDGGLLYLPPEPGLGGAVLGSLIVSDLKATNCIFYGNSVRSGDSFNGSFMPGSSGAAIGEYGVAEIVHCSFTDNLVEASAYPDPTQPPSGSAIWIATNAPAAIVQACAISGPIGVSLVAGPVTDAGFNVSADATPTFTQSSSVNNVDPLLQFFSQATYSILRPGPGSPAIDRVTVHLTDYDIRGMLRPVTGSDSGAVEVVAVTPLTIAQSNGSLNISAPAYTEPLRLLGSADLKTWVVIGSSGISTFSVPVSGPYRFFKVQFDP